MLRLGYHHAIDEDSGNFDLPRVERTALGYSLHLCNDQPVGIMYRHGDGQRFQSKRLLFHGDVSIGISGRAADNTDIDRKCAIKKKLLTFDLDEADKIILGAFVDLATTKARIDKSSKPHSREMSRALCRDVAKKVR